MPRRKSRQQTLKDKRNRRKMNRKLRRQLLTEKERLRKIRVAYPEMFEICDDYGTPCCQASTVNGTQCRRAALTTKTYYQRVRCCYLCWQHALMYGVYGILSTGKAVYESGLSWDEYCFLNPDKCEEYFKGSMLSGTYASPK